MAESRLDIIGDFGDLFPNLAKLGTVQEEIKTKNEALKESFKSSFSEGSKSSSEFAGNVDKATKSVGDEITKIEALKKKVSDLRAALDTNKADAGLVTVLTKELKAAESELTKAGVKVEEFGRKNVDHGKKGEAAYKGLKGQIMEAKVALSLAFDTYGEGSKQVNDAAGRVANLMDKQDLLNTQIQALDPDKKFNALGQVARGAAGGVEAAVGALALFGDRSETVERALVRIQAAMTFTRGINELLQLGDTWNSVRAVLGITTVAKNVDTIATEKNTIAEAENAATTTTVQTAKKGLSIWTNIATVATNVYNVALKALMGPIGWIIGGVGLIIGLFKIFSSEGENYVKTLDAMKRASEDFGRASEDTAQRNKNTLKDLENELEVFKSAGEARIAEMKKNGATERQLADEKKKLSDEVLQHEIEIGKKIQDQAAKDIETNMTRIEAIGKQINDTVAKIKSGDLSESELEKATESNSAALKEQRDLIQQNTDKRQVIQDANAKIKVIKNNAVKENADIDTSANKDEKDRIKKQNEDRIKAEKELQDVLTQLKQKEIAARASLDTDEGKIEAERQLALLEVANLEKTLIEKGKARNKNFKLSEEQEKQFQMLRYAIETNFVNKAVELQTQKQLLIAEATKSGLDKELEIFNLSFIAREKKLRQQGLNESQITLIKTNEEVKIRTEYAKKQLDIEAETSKSIIDQMKINGVSEANAERIRNQKKLEVDLEFAQKKLFSLESQRTLTENPELEKEIQAAKAAIVIFGREIETAKKDIVANREPFSLGKLFGFEGDEADKFNQAASEFLSSISEIGTTLLAQSMANVDAQIEANQIVIDDYNKRVDEIGSLIEKEEERQRKGLANNLDARKKEEAQLKAARDKALLEEKRLQDEKRKLQKEQAIINAASTASSLITSTANVIESLSGLPLGIGVVLGLAAAAALVAGFINIKNTIKSAETQSLGEGGLVGGKYHTEDGGNKYVSQDGNKILYTEKEEYYVNRKQTKRNLNLLNAINFNRENSVDLNEVFPFLKKSGILLSTDIAKPVSDKQSEISFTESNFYAVHNSGLKEEIREMKDTLHLEVSKINNRLESEPKYHTNENGQIVKTVIQGNIILETIYTNGK